MSICSVHLKIHIPKIIKKHTHVQTIYKHHFHKKPVHDHGGEEDSDEHKDGSEKYIRIDPKALSAALKVVQGGGGSGNELRSFRYGPKYHRSRDLKHAYSSPVSYKSAKFYPKNVKVIHQYEDVEPSYRRPSKSHRAIKHMMRPTYAIHEEMDEDDYDHPMMQEDYSLSESSPVKTYYKPPASMKTTQIQFIPASQVNDYIPTIPFSALSAQQSQFQPIWTPADLMARAAAKGKEQQDARLGRSSSHYEGTTSRIYTSGGPASVSHLSLSPAAPSQYAGNYQQ